MADYAISNVPRRVVYAASGTGPYAFTFEILNQTDIAVYKASTLLTLTTDYTVTINANGTGSVTLVTTAGTSNITIVGSKNIQRTTDFTTGGDLFANTLNDELDNQTIFIQQVAETAERGLKAPVTDPTDIAMTLPAKDGRKGKVLAFDSTTGNPVAGPALDSVTTVIAQSANINTVADNIASVNTVAGNTANINTVAGVSSNVTTVATNIANVNAVGSDLLEAVSEVNTVAVNITNVNTVGTNISNVNTVAGISANVTTVAGISSNVTTVAGISANVTTVAGISSDVTTVAGINQTDLSDVADIAADVDTVAGIAANVTTVAGISANVTSVAGNASNINQVAADTVAINSASANATAAAASALSASGSATSASASAAAASAVALGNEPVRHSVRPSLLLDFANTKTLDPRITFSRASTGTYYDGKTTVKAEENLLLQSQDFTTSWTTINATVISNNQTAPDGTSTAETITDDATSGNHVITQTPTCVAGVPYTFSVFMKKGTNQYGVVFITSTSVNENYVTAVVDLDAGTISKSQNGTSTTSASTNIVSVGSGWYRVSLTGTASSAFLRARFGLVDSGTPTIGINGLPANYSGTGTTIFAWGAQLEQRSSVTAYTATTTAPITNYIPALQTAAAGVARFEHNPITGESLGLEIEEQRTNLFTYSDDFSNAAWIKTGISITSNTIVSPDGALTGDKLVEDSSTGNHQAAISLTFTSGTSYSYSVYIKAAERTKATVLLGTGAFGANVTVRFDLSAQTATTTVSGTSTSASITAVGNGWFRCTVTSQATATASAAVRLYITDDVPAISYTGNGYSGIYIWGAQLEAGAFATSYIPTVASQVTRSADSASMTGTNFSSWFNQDEGTLYNEAIPAHVGTQYVSIIGDGSNSTLGIGFFTDNSRLEARVRALGAGSTIGNGLVISPNISFKAALYYSATNNAWAYNGTIRTETNTNAKPQNSADFRIGASPTGTATLTGTIKKLAYYPKRLTNAELQGLTTV